MYSIGLDVARFDATELAIHFAKHQADFTALTATDYEHLADQFLSVAPYPALMQCTRQRGDLVRYDTVTTEFGVLSAAGAIRTYFKAKPCISLPPTVPKTGCHGHPDNVTYFRAECSKW
jgi:hypothetical protein